MLMYSMTPNATGVEYVFERPVDNLVLRFADMQTFVQR
jgi:hypothetical protein